MVEIFHERRAHPRMDIHGALSYRKPESTLLNAGIIENLSLGGARIWIREKLEAPGRLMFRIESEIEQASVEFSAILLHRLPLRKSTLYGYGCAIEAVSADDFLLPDPAVAPESDLLDYRRNRINSDKSSSSSRSSLYKIC